MSLSSSISRSLSALILIASLFGCSGKQVDPNEPGQLFQEAEEDIKSDHYQIAIDRLRSIKNKFPYSKFAIDAQLRMADVYFLQESYPEAAASYEAFHELHPKHEKTAYVMFRAAKSYFNDAPTQVARDLGPANKSLASYNDFLSKFPQDPQAAEAKADVESIRNLLADKEVYIADFYAKRDAYDSAAERYKKVIALYPETKAAESSKPKLELAEKKILELQSSKEAKEGSN